jgi:hypothetical protein
LQNPTTTPSGRISNEPKERGEKKMPFIVATYVYASIQGQCMYSALTNILECPRTCISVFGFLSS